MLTKLIDLLLAFTILLSGAAQGLFSVQKDDWHTNYSYVFVHGLSGWGSYDAADQFVRYWGTMSGDYLGALENAGFHCYAVSVDPLGSAWDRACELYAQLTGTVVDYGKEHSARCRHKRFGADYRKKPLVPAWREKDKINLLGHSFGGTTVRMLSALMAEGSAAERAVTDPAELSGLFTGGKADWIYSITALSTPHNGTSAYTVAQKGKLVQRTNNGLTGDVRAALASVISIYTQPVPDGRIDDDYASVDMEIDNALALNHSLPTLSHIYYFSAPTSATTLAENGAHEPDLTVTDPLFTGSAELIGKYTGQTADGYTLDESWRENDGLVNLISARAPFGAPQKEMDGDNIVPGVWNILPTVRGDHTAFMGGLTIRHPELKSFYLEHLDRINRL